ncbi:MAG TPA: ABC transporter permease subunit [Streptosporangiaceae bacterium]|nr:ABC transporter permease subunit [Streptosporangiaceae bacterium]
MTTAVVPRPLRRVPRWGVDAGVLVVLAIGYVVFRNQWVLPQTSDHAVFRSLNSVRDWVDANRDSNPVFLYVVNYIRLGISDLFNVIQSVLHGMSWFGVTATVSAIGAVFAGWRIGLLAAAGFLSFGVLGLWSESIDTLALALTSVLLSLVVGIPLGIAAGRSARLQRLLNPVLDVMQIMPTFAYLAPLTLFFLIGAPSAVVATMIYAMPPAIRITALGIRQVAPETVEASGSLGATRWQTLRKVQLPMAKATIVLAVNQTLMMALSMVVITALIDGPGLGVNILQDLDKQNFGAMFDASLPIVVMAIVLDRLTRGISDRARRRAARPPAVLWGAAAAVVACVVAGRIVSPDFPSSVNFTFASYINTIVRWIELHLDAVTRGIQNAVAYSLLNPLQSMLTSAPWFLVVALVFGLALRISGLRPALTAAGCLASVALLGVWQDGMVTLTSVLVATVLTLAIGVLLGIAAARSRLFAAIQRPLLDTAQTLPSFVYLLPALGLFGPTRFTAIVASVIYAVPPVIRLVEDGLLGVPATVVEAATAAGSTPGQLLWKVQLPMARRALLLAANQGIVMVLAIVVIGGLVGAGGLGFDVVAGFSQSTLFGEGLAAGVAIVLFGVMLDRITQGAGHRETAIRGG